MRMGFAGLALLLLASPVAAQRQELTFEASILRGVAGWAHRIGPNALAGVEVGFGFPQIDQTIRPDHEQADFEEYLHIATFVRFQPSRVLDVDVGLRGSIADLWECTASDCWPGLFGGGYVQPMIGWRNLKFGARLVGGVIGERQEGTTGARSSVLALTPFLARLTIAW